jgi:integrase
MDLGTTSSEILAALQAHNQAPSKGPVPEEPAPFEQIAVQYIAVSEPRWGAHAATVAKSVIRKHLIAKLGHLPANKVTAKEIQTFLDEMVQGNASESLLKKAVTHLRGILDFAQETGALALNPMRSRASKIKIRPQRPVSERHLSIEECAVLLSQLAERDRLIVRMFIQLGLRPQEVFALRRQDVRGEFIQIAGVLIKGRLKKVGGKEAVAEVYVPPDLRSQLDRWMKSTATKDTDWLFPASRGRGTADLPPLNQHLFRSRNLKPAADKACVPRVDLLALRRTCANLFAHKATAADALTQLRQADPAHRVGFAEQDLPNSLKRAAVTIELELLKVIKRVEEKSRKTSDPGSRPR